MKIRFAVPAACLFVLCCVTLSVVRAQDKVDEAGQKAAEEWLALLDTAKYGDSWQKADQSFQSRTTQPQWVERATGLRDSVGPFKSRKLVQADSRTDSSGGAEREFIIVRFESAFEKAPSVSETVFTVKEKDGSWKVTNYFMRPQS